MKEKRRILAVVMIPSLKLKFKHSAQLLINFTSKYKETLLDCFNTVAQKGHSLVTFKQLQQT